MILFVYENFSFSYFSCQVLQRKTEEASLATKRLKELLESRKSSSRETSGKKMLLLCLLKLHVFIRQGELTTSCCSHLLNLLIIHLCILLM